MIVEWTGRASKIEAFTEGRGGCKWEEEQIWLPNQKNGVLYDWG